MTNETILYVHKVNNRRKGKWPLCEKCETCLITNQLLLNLWTVCVLHNVHIIIYVEQLWTCLCLTISPVWTGCYVHIMSCGTSCRMVLHVSWHLMYHGNSHNITVVCITCLVLLHVSWKSRFPLKFLNYTGQYLCVTTCGLPWVNKVTVELYRMYL